MIAELLRHYRVRMRQHAGSRCSMTDVHRTRSRPTSRHANAMHLVRVILLSLLPLALVGCVGDLHMSFLDPQGPVASAQRWHFYWVLGIMAVLVAGPIFLALPLVLWRYRYGNRKARYTPKWKFSKWIEIASWGGPIAIVVILSFFVWRDTHKLDPYKPLPSKQAPLQVQVIGYDWKWLFIYPRQGIATIGSMALPTGRPVSMQLTSATVMQSFFIPALGSQIYAMGGMVTQLNLQASHPGRLLGENTMYNGNGFRRQKFTAHAMTPAAFKAWVKNVRAQGITLDASTLKIIAKRSTRKQLTAALAPDASHAGSIYLTGVPKDLFSSVVKATRDDTQLHWTPPVVATTKTRTTATTAQTPTPTTGENP